MQEYYSKTTNNRIKIDCEKQLN